VLGKVKAPQQAILIKSLVPDYDFVMTIVSMEEIYSKRIDTHRWENIIRRDKEIFGDIPIFVWFDTGYYNSPMHISQYLNKEEQKEFLRKVDKSFLNLSKKENLPIIFVYPLSGQMMGPWKEEEKRVLSFGSFGSYDALAPEFETYETIKGLAQNKQGGEK